MQALHPADPAALTALPRGKSMPARPRARLHPHPAPRSAAKPPTSCSSPFLLSYPGVNCRSFLRSPPPSTAPTTRGQLTSVLPAHQHRTRQLSHLPSLRLPNFPTSQLPNFPTSQLPNFPTSQQANKPTSWQVGTHQRAGESSPRLSRLTPPPPPRYRSSSSHPAEPRRPVCIPPASAPPRSPPADHQALASPPALASLVNPRSAPNAAKPPTPARPPCTLAYTTT